MSQQVPNKLQYPVTIYPFREHPMLKLLVSTFDLIMPDEN
ncbi:hypothetical protein tooticki91_gp034 [Flavobacterium phage vB_FspS_tooticki9-1]|uniref:Uncharacterized protein n=11 Tax=Caudoviricetes TaxID=2731619 RepID=A0A6B9LGB1_9CAUD|nr:hypothetical protein HWC88_gp43 [Flavobacterium phage vB_FspS_hattifnatt9-1]YP_009854767.1 hypothetical protein HWC89_gp39 [Flavobacterium phage vB_FspS_hemulen6-1]YP_009855179.1 hypothetical protein HWC95_gp43 [Flavobacterium phage vB_FspS_sniff9-1]YP_009855252.1 hypothetical protein HWC96_gp42 [Flavobacterium phage vB_FspS_snork6-1]YP_009855391.1 hypothetical protein HWC98_gp36 [Flavobacterium phage vB_FspS_stinky9-1]YP_009855520.1 hypothetical protein HWD00_gp34 [Flavobacterium phage vB_